MPSLFLCPNTLLLSRRLHSSWSNEGNEDAEKATVVYVATLCAGLLILFGSMRWTKRSLVRDAWMPAMSGSECLKPCYLAK